MADFFNEPQIKAHVDMRFGNNWRFWSRYVTSSTSLTQGSATKYLLNGEYQDFRQTRYRYYQFALEKKTPLNESWSLKSLFGLSSIDVHNVEKWDSDLDNSKYSLIALMTLPENSVWVSVFGVPR